MPQISIPLNALPVFPLLRSIIVVVIIFAIFSYVLNYAKKTLLKTAKTKKHISNINIFISILRYSFFLFLLLAAIFSYSGSFASLGLFIGLLSAALGFALQKPITGVAAWLLIVSKRPFEIGDRIIIGSIKGDVQNISLSHIYLNEVGGLLGGEERSGRTVMIPNHMIYENSIVNYSMKDDHVLAEVPVSITYESDMDQAVKIVMKAIKKHAKEFIKVTGKEPYTRLTFEPSGINIRGRYFIPFYKQQSTASQITKEIYDQIMKTKGVEIAYPHTEIIYRAKK